MNSNKEVLTQTVQDLTDFKFNLLQSIKMLRWVGYGLLIVMLISLIETLIPFRPMNQTWEFNAFQQIVERMPIPLMGFMLVFHGQRYGRTVWELRLMRWLSWSTFVIAIALFLLIPLGIRNTIRIDDTNQAKFNLQATQIEQNFDTVQRNLEQAETPEQIGRIAVLLKRPDLAQKLSDPTQAPVIKRELTQLANTSQSQLNIQSSMSRSGQRTQLLKQSIKLNLIALISGIVSLGLWRSTEWARNPN